MSRRPGAVVERMIQAAGRQGGSAKLPRRQLLKRLWVYVRSQHALIIACAVLVVLGNVIALVGPRLSGHAIDAIGIGKGAAVFPRVYHYAALMAGCYLISAVLNYVLTRLILRLRRNVIFQMRRDVFNRLVSLPVSYFDRRQTGDILSVISYDIDTVNESFSSDLIQVLRSLITVVVSLVMMLLIEPALVLTFVLTVPLSIFYTRWLTRKSRPLFRKRSETLGQLNGFMEEMMAGQKTTKAYAREEQVIERFDSKNAEAVRAFVKSEHMGTLVGPSVNFINNLSLSLVSVFGGLLFLSGRVALGDISSFVQYSRRFSGPINEVASIVGELQSAFAAAERVFRLIDEQPEKADPADARTLSQAQGDVRLANVCFSYVEGKPVIRDFSLHAKPGQLIAIVGPTGAGKTTIINLLMRFYDIDSGSIRVDDSDIYGLKRDSLRRAYTMVLQDTWLFRGTIFENIAYGKEDATMEEVENAAKCAMIHSFIKRLPKGYDTLIGDRGVNISKGQKQLLTIARAMLVGSSMLILDEATSNVDTNTEQQIQKAMLKLLEGRTSFVIAHRLSTIRNADHILVVNDGNIVEQGRHAELMAKNGFYRRLYNAQFETA